MSATPNTLNLSVENVTVRYSNGHEALRETTFDLSGGSICALVGVNGSGKSTLLQIIAGTLQASAGTVDVTGRVAALLELGSGFDPDFTGHENIYLNASILGLTKEDIIISYIGFENFAMDIEEIQNKEIKKSKDFFLWKISTQH
mgnify:CR=1 FL=1